MNIEVKFNFFSNYKSKVNLEPRTKKSNCSVLICSM